MIALTGQKPFWVALTPSSLTPDRERYVTDAAVKDEAHDGLCPDELAPEARQSD